MTRQIARGIACLALMAAAASRGADDTWVGNTSVLWNADNWTGGNSPPVSGDALFFGPAGAAGAVLTNDFAGFVATGITFNADASAYTVSPNWTVLLGDIVNNSTNLQTLNLGHQLNANVHFDAAAGGMQFLTNNTINLNGYTLTVTGAYDTLINLVVGGTTTNSRLLKAGSGTLTLSRANNFVGDLVINDGTVVGSVAANSANPAAAALGNMTLAGRQITVHSNATLRMTANDAMGSYLYKTPVLITVDGGTIANGQSFMSIGDIVLRNGARLTTTNGAAAAFQAFNLRGSITVSGTSGSFINTTGTATNGIHLGGTTIPATPFNVGVTGDTNADLTVSAPLINEVYYTGALFKTGEGRMLLLATNGYTGATTIHAGVLALGVTNAVASSSVIIVGTNAGTTAVLDVSALGGAYSPAVAQTLKGYGTVTGGVTVAGGTKLLAGDAGVAGTLHFAGDLTMAAGSTNLFDLTGPGTGGSNDLISVGGTLNLDSNGVIVINGLMLPAGEYALFSYGAGYNGAAPLIGNYASRQNPHLTNHDNTVWLSLTGSTADLFWTGSGGTTWQTNGAANWNDGGGAAVFADMDRVTIDERGAPNTAITVAGTVRPGALVVSNSTVNYAFSGTGSIAGLGGLTKRGTGTLTVGNGNAYTGDTAIEGGKVIFGAGGTTAAGSRIVVGDGATLTFARNDTWGVANTTSSGAITVNAGGTLASGGQFQTLWSPSVYGGTVLLNGGVNATYPAFQIGGTLTVTGTASVVVGAGSNNAVNIGGQGTPVLTVNVVGSNDLLTVNSPLQNSTVTGGTQAGSLTKTGGGTLVLVTTNTYTGSTVVNAGALIIPPGGALTATALVNPIGAGSVSVSGLVTVANNGGFAIGCGTAGLGTCNIETGAVVNIGGGSGAYVGRVYIGGKLDGSGVLGTGTLNLNGGVLNVAVGGTSSPGDGGRLWINAWGNGGTSTLNLNGGALNTARLISDGGAGGSVLNFNGGLLRMTTNLATLIYVSAAYVRNGGVNLDIQTNSLTLGQALLHSAAAGDAAMDGGLTKSGSGTLLLTGASSFTGNIRVNEGELQASLACGADPVASSLGNPAAAGRTATVPAGTTLRLMSHDILGNGATANTQLKFIVAGTLANNGGQYNLLRDIELQGGLLKATGGANANYGSYGLYGTVTTTGGTNSTISASGTYGVIHMGTQGSAGPAAFNVGAGADLVVNAVLVDRAGGAGAGAMVKSGPGTLLLTYTNTFSGGTTISAGTLLVNGGLSPTGTVTVLGGTLGGTGTVGSVTTFAGGVLSPGNPAEIGALTVLGDLHMISDSVYAWDSGAVTSDLVAVSGTLYAPARLTVSAALLGGGSVIGQTLMTFGALSGSANVGGWRILGAPGIVYAAVEGNRIVLREKTGAILMVR